MAVYVFENFHSFAPIPRAAQPLQGVVELSPAINAFPPALTQTSDNAPRYKPEGDGSRNDPTYVQDVLEPGFHYLDEGIKHYFSDIRIPDRDGFRFMKVRIAGGSKSIQAWRDDLKHGRATLPVMSISRTTHSYNPEKFSPTFHAMSRSFLGDGKDKIKKVFRPSPWLVEYTCEMWAESKRDIEYALHQILPRFNGGLAEFTACDNHIIGTVTLRYGSSSDATEKDAGAEQIAKIRYDVSMTAEAWLALPEQVVPSILTVNGSIRLDDEAIPFDRIRV